MRVAIPQIAFPAIVTLFPVPSSSPRKNLLFSYKSTDLAPRFSFVASLAALFESKPCLRTNAALDSVFEVARVKVVTPTFSFTTKSPR